MGLAHDMLINIYLSVASFHSSFALNWKKHVCVIKSLEALLLVEYNLQISHNCFFFLSMIILNNSALQISRDYYIKVIILTKENT